MTINDYIYNVKGSEEEKKKVAVTILNSELQTTQELQFHLIIHQPYRAVEGLLIDIKTRYTGRVTLTVKTFIDIEILIMLNT